MKKISILLLAVFYIGIANLSAQDATTEAVTTTEEAKEVKICAKTGKTCDEKCENKKNGTCCKGKKAKEGSFNFNKSNNYNGKSSCSKSAKKSCCKKKAKKCGEGCTKACCAKAEDTEEAPAEEASSEE
jgi:hypothetical protein